MFFCGPPLLYIYRSYINANAIVYFEKKTFFNGSTEKYAGVLYGLAFDNDQSVH